VTRRPPPSSTPRTLFEKIWTNHVVEKETDTTPAILYVDLHLVHEVTSAQAFAELRKRGLSVRAPHRTIATMDHSTPTGSTSSGARGFTSLPVIEPDARLQLDTLERNCGESGIPLLPLGDGRRGIVHVIGPELGLTRPGITSAATATRARTALSARSHSASAPLRSRRCWRRNACCRTSPRLWKFGLRDGYPRVLPQRISSSPSVNGLELAELQATSSNTRVAQSARYRWKSG
jgi:hypothetical protein